MEVENVHSYVSENATLHNCGDFGILMSLKKAIFESNLSPSQVLTVAGIGCSSKLPQWLKTYGFHSIHGRALPVATGARLANNKLKVVVTGGDGDGYGIGMGHFIHAMRRNLDITYIVFNNQVYGLTKGQVSPTAIKGFKSPSTLAGVIEQPVNPITLALSAQATFIARAFAGNIPHLTQMIKEGMAHKGFSLIDVFQPCVTFNHINTYQWFQKHIYDLQKEGHDTSDRIAAFKAADDPWQEKIPIGVFYKTERPTYEEESPQIAELPLVKHDLSKINVSSTMEKLI